MTLARWQFWINRGGTFTNVVARRPDGALLTARLSSEDPGRYPDAAMEAIRRLTGITDGHAGAPGAKRAERADGIVEPFGIIAKLEMRPGGVFAVDTPDGRGWRAPG